MEKERRAMYAGSFDPFTNGHLHIVMEAAKMFDEVYICIAHNASKKRNTSLTAMQTAIEEMLVRKKITNVKVVIHYGLVAEYCKDHEIGYLIRGLRNTSDYMYEENIAKINFEINPDLKTIYYRAQNEVISSSMVRELHSFGKDVSKYLPQEIYDIL